MAIIKSREIAFDDIKHVIIDILLVKCHRVLFSIWVSEYPKFRYTLGDFAFGVHAKEFCRCEYRSDYSAAFCVFEPLQLYFKIKILTYLRFQKYLISYRCAMFWDWKMTYLFQHKHVSKSNDAYK